MASRSDKVFPPPKKPADCASLSLKVWEGMLQQQGRSSSTALDLQLLTEQRYIDQLSVLPILNLIHHNIKPIPRPTKSRSLSASTTTQPYHTKPKNPIAPTGPVFIDISSDEDGEVIMAEFNNFLDDFYQKEQEKQRRKELEKTQKFEEKKPEKANLGSGVVINIDEIDVIPSEEQPVAVQQRDDSPFIIQKYRRRPPSTRPKPPKRKQINKSQSTKNKPKSQIANDAVRITRQRQRPRKAKSLREEESQQSSEDEETPAIRVGPRYQACIPPWSIRQDDLVQLRNEKVPQLMERLLNPIR